MNGDGESSDSEWEEVDGGGEEEVELLLSDDADSESIGTSSEEDDDDVGGLFSDEDGEVYDTEDDTEDGATAIVATVCSERCLTMTCTHIADTEDDLVVAGLLKSTHENEDLDKQVKKSVTDRLIPVLRFSGTGAHPLSAHHFLQPGLTDDQVAKILQKAADSKKGILWLCCMYEGSDARVFKLIFERIDDMTQVACEYAISSLVTHMCAQKNEDMLEKILAEYASPNIQAVVYRGMVENDWHDGYEKVKKYLKPAAIRTVIKNSMKGFFERATCNCVEGIYSTLNNKRQLASEQSYCVKCNPRDTKKVKVDGGNVNGEDETAKGEVDKEVAFN